MADPKNKRFFRASARLPHISMPNARVIASQLDLTLISFMAFPLIVMTVFLLAPLASTLKEAFFYHGELSLQWFRTLFQSKEYVNLQGTGEFYYIHRPRLAPETMATLVIRGKDYGIILNSLIVATSVTFAATTLGLIIAFVLARYEFPGKRFFRILAVVPMLVTPFINAYVVKKLFLEDGLVSWLLHDVLHILPWRLRIEGYAGVALAQTMTYFPIAYLNIYSSLINIDPSMEEQAENLGARGFRLFRTVTLPLAMPGIAAGATLIFIFSLEDLGAPIVFRGSAERLISYKIYNEFINMTGQLSAEVAALAVLLLFIAATGFIIIRRYVSLKSYAMISRGGRWKPRVSRPGLKGLLVIYLVILPLIVFTALPQFGVIATAFSKEWRGPLPSIIDPKYWDGLRPEGATLEYMVKVFKDPSVNVYVINSLKYSLAALVIIVLVALTASYAVSRARLPGLSIIDTLITLPIAMPGLAVAVSYVFFFSSAFRGTLLDPTDLAKFNPAALLIIAYAIRKLPFTARAVFAGLQQTHVALEEAAMNLGSGRLRTIGTIVLPLIALNILSGAMVSFIYCVTEVSVSITVGGIKHEYAPLTFYMKNAYLAEVQAIPVTAALGVLLIIIQLTVITLVTLGFKQKYAVVGV